MAFKNIHYLKSILRSPDTLRKIYWIGNEGYSLWSGRNVIFKDGAFVFMSRDLPADYDQPAYESSNPYQKASLDLVREFPDGIVVDLGAGNPRHSFPNVCQVEIRKYPDTDIVVAEGRIPLKSNSVDGVISQAVLEHVRNPFLHVSEIFRILRPGGKVLLDTAFMQPLHGYPRHYFNTTAHAVRVLFENFRIDSLSVGPHQHPWITLHWILNSYYNGMKSEEDRELLRRTTVGEVMDVLNEHQGLRTRIKRHDNPFSVSENLMNFNADHSTSLGMFTNITGSCEEELAAGFQVRARKPGPPGEG